MILLEPGNRILQETVGAQINWDPEEKREPIDVRLCDFDDVSYRVIIDKDSKSLMRVSMNLPCYKTIEQYGGKEAVETHYQGLAVAAAEGYDVTLEVNLDDCKDKDGTIKRIGMMKSRVVGGVFDHFLSNLLKGGAPAAPFRFALRKDTEVFFFPGADRVIMVFALDFHERVDKAVARVFMQEFVDCRRSLGAAPPCTWGVDPPSEMKHFNITQNSGNLGFVSFAVLKSHLANNRKDQIVAVLQSFRNFVQYHIKCSKSFFHSRMRARVKELLLILNRAKVITEEDKKNMKTMTGKTFARKT
jgi:actin related protein 2/3 complex subunit 2